MRKEPKLQNRVYTTPQFVIKLNDLKNARAYTTATIEASLSPNIASYYTLLAYLHERASAYKSAQNAYLKALQLSVNSNTYYSLGILNDFRLKDKTTALRYYRKYLQSNPDKKLSLENISYVKALTN